MKHMLTKLMLLFFLAGCGAADSGDKFVGAWTQVNVTGITPITANIRKQGNDFLIDLSLPLPNQEPARMKKTGKFENGKLIASDMEKITIVALTGHMMIGANEYEKNK